MPPLETGLLGPAARCGERHPVPAALDRHAGRRRRLLDDAAGAGWRIDLGRPPGARARRRPPAPVVIGGPDPAAWQERDGVLARWFDRHGCCGAIVRPDHYVYAALHEQRRPHSFSPPSMRGYRMQVRPARTSPKVRIFSGRRLRDAARDRRSRHAVPVPDAELLRQAGLRPLRRADHAGAARLGPPCSA